MGSPRQVSDQALQNLYAMASKLTQGDRERLSDEFGVTIETHKPKRSKKRCKKCRHAPCMCGTHSF